MDVCIVQQSMYAIWDGTQDTKAHLVRLIYICFKIYAIIVDIVFVSINQSKYKYSLVQEDSLECKTNTADLISKYIKYSHTVHYHILLL